MKDTAQAPAQEKAGWVDRFFAKDFANPDIGRGLRCMLSYMAPLALAIEGSHPAEMTFAALAAQNVANADVRGAYGLRLSLLVCMAVVLASASALGAYGAQSLPAGLAAAALLALGAGLWRHLSSDYGPGLAISTSLLGFIAMVSPAGPGSALDHARAALAGGCWGAFLHIVLWPIRPQHPLRLAAAETWQTIAKAATVRADPAVEAEIRAALDKAYAILGSARARRNRLVVDRLEALNRTGARLAQRVSALQHALEPAAVAESGSEAHGAAEAAFSVLGNLSRTIALAVVSRQPGQLAAAEVRLKRLDHLLKVLEGKLGTEEGGDAAAAARTSAAQLRQYLDEVCETLRRTVDRASDQGAFSLELSDLAHLKLRPLTAALNLSWRVDAALLRYTGRVLVLLLFSVWAMKTFELRHGYWVPMTIMIVLQPDFGSTRKRAVERLIGTVAGSLLASAFLWLRLPLAAIMAATAATAFGFGYYLRRNYATAVVFITLFVVFLTEAIGPVSLQLTVERVADTTAGGLLALLAAVLFWPIWERARFRPILARALRANADYLSVVGERLSEGKKYDMTVVRAKRGAEAANAAVFSSLQRMSGDPEGLRARVSEIAAVSNGNQRVTRALNLIVLQAHPDAPIPAARLVAGRLSQALHEVADAVEVQPGGADALQRARQVLAEPRPRDCPAVLAISQLDRAKAEIGALVLGVEALQESPAPGQSAEPVAG